MNYYNKIKNELKNNEINSKVKNYSINKSDLNTYYNIGKILSEAGKRYNYKTLYRMRKFYKLFSMKKRHNGVKIKLDLL